MADLTIIALNVVADFNATIVVGVAGEALSAGDVVYADSADSDELKQAIHTGTAAQAAAVGIVLADAADTAAVTYITAGELSLGSILTAGAVYVVSGTAAKIAITGDQGSGDYTTVIGAALSTSTLKVKFVVGGVAV